MATKGSLPKYDYSKFEKLAPKKGALPEHDYSKFESLADSGSDSGAFVAGAADTAALGYTPQLSALAEKPIFSLMNKLQGTNIKPDNYVTARDKYAAELAATQERSPKSYLAGQVGGGLLSAGPMSKALSAGTGGFIGNGGATAAQRIMNTAKAGAATGLLYNPGDKEGVVDEFQAIDRLKGAGIGGAAGLGMGALGERLSSTGQKITNLSGTLQDAAENTAFKATGPMLKEYRQQYNRNRINELGREALDSGLVGVGSTIDSVAKNAAKSKETLGKELGDIYKKAAPKIKKTPLDKQELYFDIAQNVVKHEPAVGKDAFYAKMNNAIKDIMGDSEIYNNPMKLNQKITDIDKKISYERKNLIKDGPDFEQGLFQIRSVLRDKLNKQVDNIANTVGDPQLGARLRQTNKKYRNMSDILSISEDRVLREDAKKMWGLTDTIAAGAMATGAMASGQTPVTSTLLTGGIMGAKKLGEKYGYGVAAKGLDTASKLTKPIKYTGAGQATEGLGNLIINRGQSFKKPGLINK